MMAATKERQTPELLRDLDQRRRDLGMTYRAVAKRSGLSMRTVQRTLAGEATAANLRTILAIASALESRITLGGADINTVRLRQASQKADRLVKMLQGTSALEAQAIDAREMEGARQRTIRDLLAAGRTAFWDD